MVRDFSPEEKSLRLGMLTIFKQALKCDELCPSTGGLLDQGPTLEFDLLFIVGRSVLRVEHINRIEKCGHIDCPTRSYLWVAYAQFKQRNVTVIFGEEKISERAVDLQYLVVLQLLTIAVLWNRKFRIPDRVAHG